MQEKPNAKATIVDEITFDMEVINVMAFGKFEDRTTCPVYGSEKDPREWVCTEAYQVFGYPVVKKVQALVRTAQNGSAPHSAEDWKLSETAWKAVVKQARQMVRDGFTVPLEKEEITDPATCPFCSNPKLDKDTTCLDCQDKVMASVMIKKMPELVGINDKQKQSAVKAVKQGREDFEWFEGMKKNVQEQLSQMPKSHLNMAFLRNHPLFFKGKKVADQFVEKGLEIFLDRQGRQLQASVEERMADTYDNFYLKGGGQRRRDERPVRGGHGGKGNRGSKRSFGF